MIRITTNSFSWHPTYNKGLGELPAADICRQAAECGAEGIEIDPARVTAAELAVGRVPGGRGPRLLPRADRVHQGAGRATDGHGGELMADRKAFIINVGANASHGALRSPIFNDGTFFFVPIPGSDSEDAAGRRVRRYRDILPEALPYIPVAYHDVRTHNDPEFETFTYGDYPASGGRPGLLKHISKGDYLCFLARLVKWSRKDGGFTDHAGFYIVGYFEVGEIFRDVTSASPKSVLKAVANNAHVRRLSDWYDDAGWVIKGTPNSKLLHRAMPFDRKLADRIMRDRNGEPWVWDPNRTELQVIGSYTRSCRMIDDPARVDALLRRLRKH